MTNYSSADIITFAEEMWGAKLTEAQKEMLRGLSEGRLYVQAARGGGKSFLTHSVRLSPIRESPLTRYLGQWIADEENAEPSTTPYSLDYDSLMEGVSV